MKTYAIFNRKYDCEIWVNLKWGTLESMDTVREMIFIDLEANPSLEAGYVESYPFFQAEWQSVGGRMDKDFDFNQILEVENDYGAFKGKEQFLLAHLERLTEIVNIALDECVIEDDSIVCALDKELDTVKGIS